MNAPRKLRLHRETLQRLDVHRRSDTVADDQSCDQSCYFVSCDDPAACTISIWLKAAG